MTRGSEVCPEKPPLSRVPYGQWRWHTVLRRLWNCIAADRNHSSSRAAEAKLCGAGNSARQSRRTSESNGRARRRSGPDTAERSPVSDRSGRSLPGLPRRLAYHVYGGPSSVHSGAGLPRRRWLSLLFAGPAEPAIAARNPEPSAAQRSVALRRHDRRVQSRGTGCVRSGAGERSDAPRFPAGTDSSANGRPKGRRCRSGGDRWSDARSERSHTTNGARRRHRRALRLADAGDHRAGSGRRGRGTDCRADRGRSLGSNADRRGARPDGPAWRRGVADRRHHGRGALRERPGDVVGDPRWDAWQPQTDGETRAGATGADGCRGKPRTRCSHGAVRGRRDHGDCDRDAARRLPGLPRCRARCIQAIVAAYLAARRLWRPRRLPLPVRRGHGRPEPDVPSTAGTPPVVARYSAGLARGGAVRPGSETGLPATGPCRVPRCVRAVAVPRRPSTAARGSRLPVAPGAARKGRGRRDA